MRRMLLLVLLLCGAGVATEAQSGGKGDVGGVPPPACTRNLEVGFSYCAPEGWTATAKLDDRFKLLVAPTVPVFTPNINVKSEPCFGSLDEHVALNVRTIVDDPKKGGATAVKVLDQAPFMTAAGVRTVRVRMHVEASSIAVRALQYYFAGRGTDCYVISGLALESAAATYEPIFDQVTRSLLIDR